MSTWISRLTAAVYHEYDRRIKRASLIEGYNTHGQHNQHPEESVAHDEDEGVVIANLPRGSLVAQAPGGTTEPKH